MPGPGEAAGLPGYGMGMSSVPTGTGYPTQQGVQGLDTAWEGSVPREEPQRVLGACHMCCPSSCTGHQGSSAADGVGAPAARGGGCALCSSLRMPRLGPMPWSLQADLLGAGCSWDMARARLVLPWGLWSSVCAGIETSRGPSVCPSSPPQVCCQQPQGSPSCPWPGTSMVALVPWRTPAASLPHAGACCRQVVDAEHPPGLCGRLLSHVLSSTPPGSAGLLALPSALQSREQG